jgi:hypothetical protein
VPGQLRRGRENVFGQAPNLGGGQDPGFVFFEKIPDAVLLEFGHVSSFRHCALGWHFI